jgi:hypothetical protein
MHSIPGGGDGKKIEPKKICWGMGGFHKQHSLFRKVY